MAWKCLYCNKPLPEYRSMRRKFCDDTCRVYYSRLYNPQKLYNEAMAILTRFGRVSETDRDSAIRSLNVLKGYINEQLRALGDRDSIELHQMLNERHKKS